MFKITFYCFAFICLTVPTLWANSQPVDSQPEGSSQIVPLPTETWWQPCRDCSNNPVSSSCANNGKETYKPEVLFEFPLSQFHKSYIAAMCADKDGTIYLLLNGLKPKVQIRKPSGVLIREFPWVRDKFDAVERAYEIRVDEKGNILVIGMTVQGMGRIYDPKGNLQNSFKYKGDVANAFERARLYKSWFSHGIVYTMKDGLVVFRPKPPEDSGADDSGNTLKGFQFKRNEHPKDGVQQVTSQDGKVFSFPDKLNHGDFWGMTFVDDAGNLYGYYEASFDYGTYVDGYGRDRLESEFHDRVYKFDRNMNLLTGFQFVPAYIEPSTEVVYCFVEDFEKKVARIIRWAK